MKAYMIVSVREMEQMLALARKQSHSDEYRPSATIGLNLEVQDDRLDLVVEGRCQADFAADTRLDLWSMEEQCEAERRQMLQDECDDAMPPILYRNGRAVDVG